MMMTTVIKLFLALQTSSSLSMCVCGGGGACGVGGRWVEDYVCVCVEGEARGGTQPHQCSHTTKMKDRDVNQLT